MLWNVSTAYYNSYKQFIQENNNDMFLDKMYLQEHTPNVIFTSSKEQAIF